MIEESYLISIKDPKIEKRRLKEFLIYKVTKRK